MSASAPFKVLVIGPSRSKKTGLVNFLAGLQDGVIPLSPTAPTVALRICNATPSAALSSSVPGGIELWDVSGDQAYEATWPAIATDAKAILIVFDAEAVGASKEIELWYEWFATKYEMPFDRVLCLGWKSGAGRPAVPSLGPVAVELLHPEDIDGVKKAFEKFILRVVASKRAPR